jgi:hypothetical protein
MRIIDEEALMKMRHAEGRWAVYENQALDSANAGHMQFLKFGAECTYETPPTRYPVDTGHGMGWRYILAGEVNLATGCVESLGQAESFP